MGAGLRASCSKSRFPSGDVGVMLARCTCRAKRTVPKPAPMPEALVTGLIRPWSVCMPHSDSSVRATCPRGTTGRESSSMGLRLCRRCSCPGSPCVSRTSRRGRHSDPDDEKGWQEKGHEKCESRVEACTQMSSPPDTDATKGGPVCTSCLACMLRQRRENKHEWERMAGAAAGTVKTGTSRGLGHTTQPRRHRAPCKDMPPPNGPGSWEYQNQILHRFWSVSLRGRSTEAHVRPEVRSLGQQPKSGCSLLGFVWLSVFPAPTLAATSKETRLPLDVRPRRP